MVAIFFDQQLTNSWTYVMQGYYLIGTYFTYYTDVSKNEETFGGTDNYKTGIYNKGSKTLQEVNTIKSLFQSQEITMMEGSCFVQDKFAFGCLIGLFVDSQHLEQLKEKEIEVVQGGFIGEIEILQGEFIGQTDAYNKEREIKKFFWGTANIPTSHKLAASFYSMPHNGDKDPKNPHRCYVYLYLENGSNKPALISHLWHGGDLVFGNKESSAFTSRNVFGKQIIQSWSPDLNDITYILSISWS